VIADLAEVGSPESIPRSEGRSLVMIVLPKAAKSAAGPVKPAAAGAPKVAAAPAKPAPRPRTPDAEPTASS